MIVVCNIFLVSMLFASTACAPPTPTTPPTIETPSASILVEPSEQYEKDAIPPRTVPQDNCDADAGQATTEYEYVESAYHTASFGSDITVEASGNVSVPGIGEVGLGLEVARHHGIEYGTEHHERSTITLNAEPGTNMLHTFRLIEKGEVGTAIVETATQTKQYTYTFPTEFTLQSSHTDMGCPPPEIVTVTSLVSDSNQESQYKVRIYDPSNRDIIIQRLELSSAVTMVCEMRALSLEELLQGQLGRISSISVTMNPTISISEPEEDTNIEFTSTTVVESDTGQQKFKTIGVASTIDCTSTLQPAPSQITERIAVSIQIETDFLLPAQDYTEFILIVPTDLSFGATEVGNFGRLLQLRLEDIYSLKIHSHIKGNEEILEWPR